MLPTFLLALREGIEAALIVGLLLSVLRRVGRPECARAVWGGVTIGVAVSVIAALMLRHVGWTLEGKAEAIFEGAASWVAAGLLTGMIFWLRRQAGFMRAALERDLRNAVACGESAVFAVAFAAVTREGVELAIFLTAASSASDPLLILLGAFTGLLTAALAGWSLFATSLRFDLRRFFQVSNVLLLLFAAGLVAKGTGEFSEAGWIAPVTAPLWNTSEYLSEASLGGATLKSLFGYTSTPSLAQAVAYIVFLAGIVLWSRRQPLRR